MCSNATAVNTTLSKINNATQIDKTTYPYYCSSTENNQNDMWYVHFNSNIPEGTAQKPTNSVRVRAVFAF